MANQTQISDWAASTNYAADDIVTIAGALWRRTAAGTSGSSWDLDEKLKWAKLTPDETLEAFTVYVDGTDGDDANSGSVTSPVKTIAGAYNRVPDRVLHPVLLDIVDDAAPYEIAPLRKDVVREPIGVSGKSLVTEVLASTAAQAGTSAAKIVTSGGLTTNAYRGLWFEIIGGAGQGTICQIAWNDADTIYPVCELGYYGSSSPPDDTSTFRVIRPKVELVGTDLLTEAPSILADNLGGGVSGPVPGSEHDGMLHLAFVVLRAPDSTASGLEVRNSRVALWATEIKDCLFGESRTSQLLSGTDATPISGGSVGPYELGLAPNKNAWRGAGFLSAANSVFGAVMDGVKQFWGFACFGAPQVFNGERIVWMGGSVVADGNNGDEAAITVTTKGRGFTRIGDNASSTTPVMIFMDNPGSIRSHGILLFGGAQLELRYTTIVYDTAQVGIGLFSIGEGHSPWPGPGTIAAGDNVRVNGGPQYLAAAANGGRICTREGILHDVSPSGADYAVMPVQVTDTPLVTHTGTPAEGWTITDSARFTIIRRGS